MPDEIGNELLGARTRALEAQEETQAGNGAPGHTAADGTYYWDYTNGDLYINNSGVGAFGAVWQIIGGGGIPAAPHQLLDNPWHTDTTTNAPVRGDVITAQGVPPTTWNRIAHPGAAAQFLRANAVDPGWAAIVAGDLPGLGGVPALTYTVANAAGAAATYVQTDAQLAIFDVNVPTTIAADDAAATGVIAFAARRDHTHGFPTVVPVNIGVANAEGTAYDFVRSDHVHAHPAGLGVNLHHNEIHVVNSTGPHAEAGLTIGHVLRATAANAFSFAALIAADLPAHTHAGAGTGGSLVVGTTDTDATAGSIFFAGVAGVIQEDNANIFYNNTTNHLGIGTAVPGNAHLHITDAALTSTSTFYGIRNEHTKTGGAGAAGDDYYGVYSDIGLNQATTIDNMWGFWSRAVLTTGTTDAVLGGSAEAQIDGGTVNVQAYGLQCLMDVNTGTINGPISGVRVRVDIEAGATCNGDIYGLYAQVDDDDNTSTSYMIYLDELSNIDFGVYQNGTADNYFGGAVGINETSPDELLHITASGSNKPRVKIENTNADTTSPGIEFYKSTASPADFDGCGNIEFYGRDSGANDERYAFIRARMMDVTDTDEGGELAFFVTMNSTDRSFIEMNGYAGGVVDEGSIVFNENSQDIDIRFESDGDTHAYFMQASDGYTGINQSAPGTRMHITENDAATTTTTDVLTVEHISSNTPQPDFGCAILFRMEEGTPATVDAMRLGAVWQSAAAAENAEFQVLLNYDGTLYDVGVLVGPGAGTIAGNQRGTGAVDWQATRTVATQVASGSQAIICGGQQNTASGVRSIVLGGSANTASSSGVVLGGASNSASSTYAVTIAGTSNIASGTNSLASGFDAHATHTYSHVHSATNAQTLSWGNNTWTARCHGGARFYSAAGVATGVEVVATTGDFVPLAPKTHDLGSAALEWDNIYYVTANTGTSRLVNSSRNCPVCDKLMKRGTGTLCIMGEDTDYAVVFCIECGNVAVEEWNHQESGYKERLREPPEIVVENIRVKGSGRHREVAVDFQYGDVRNSTRLSDEEIHFFINASSKEKKIFLHKLGLREWESREENRLMQEQCVTLEKQLQDSALEFIGKNIYTRTM
jgi:hypothetical protein